MAKNNKKGTSYRGNQSKKDYINNLVAATMESKEKDEAERLEEDRQEALKTMTEEEKYLFMSQEEILDKEKDVEKREKKLTEKETALNEREAQIIKDVDDLKKRKQEVFDKEKELAGREAEISTEETRLGGEKRALEKKASDLANQERSLIERENNAETGFNAQNQKALEALRKNQITLKKEIAELETRKIAAEDELQDEIKRIHDTKLEQVEKEISDYASLRRTEIDFEIKQLRENAKRAIEEARALIDEERLSLAGERKMVNEQKNKQDKAQRDLDEAADDLGYRESIFEEDKNEYESRIQREVERRIQSTSFELEQVKDDLERYKARLKEAQDTISDYKEKERSADGMTVEELIEKIDFLKEENASLARENADLPNKEQFTSYQSKAENYDRLARQLHDTTVELEQLKRDQDQYLDLTIKLSDSRKESDYYKKLVEVRQAIIEKYGDEVNRLKSLYEQPKELAAREETIKMAPLKRRPFADVTSGLSEVEWLNNICDKCEASDIELKKRLVYAFHTALKTAGWSPLTVLAGVSGTGKSILPEYYSRYGGFYFLSIPVQPDWDSPQSLFGYFNSVDNRFNATRLLQEMVQFRSDQEDLETNLSDSMYIVLLDEMNLAHVELYFSDMLSKLEQCRNSKNPITIDIDLGAGMPKYELPLSDNILWVGTMNEDETTKSLSDKVLDRGNLISFPRPRKFKSRHAVKGVEESQMLKREKWADWLLDNVIEHPLFVANIEKYKVALENVNEVLIYAGRALGHRVWQAVENYIANHPLVIAACNAENADKNKVNNCMQGAFEEALVFKVMPKLRGIETDGETKTLCLDKIASILFDANTGVAPGLKSDFEKATHSAYETFIWNNAQYLEDERLFE